MRLLLRAACALALGLSAPGAPPALAGAWTLPEGEGIAIFTTQRKVAPAASFFGGIAETDETSTQVFAEFGVLEELTLGLTAYGKFSALDDDAELRVGGHARYRIWQGLDGDVVSFQVGVGLPAERWLGGGLGDNRPDSVVEVDFRALYGRGWGLDWANAFVSTELGYRLRGEGQPDEIRFDTVAGIEPWRGVMGLLGVYTTVPLGGGDGDGDGDGDQDISLKLAPSLAYTFWPAFGANDKKPDGPISPTTVQAGIVWDALAPEDGIGVSISIWRRF